MPAEPRWEPDDQLVPAVLATARPRTRMTALPHPDRCWVVAGLTLHGLTAEDIATRMSCSLRLVRSLRADDLTQVCLHVQQEAQHFRDELRLTRSEHRAALLSLDAANQEVKRLRSQLARILHTSNDRCAKGHAMTPYNTYEHPATGRRWCRTCHRERQAAYRANRRQTA